MLAKDNMNQFLDSVTKKLLYGFVGFGVPMILILLQVILDWGTLPVMIIAITWFGFALLFYLGMTEDESPL